MKSRNYNDVKPLCNLVPPCGMEELPRTATPALRMTKMRIASQQLVPRHVSSRNRRWFWRGQSAGVALVQLMFLSVFCARAAGQVLVLPEGKNADLLAIDPSVNVSLGARLSLQQQEDDMLLINLNTMVTPKYEGWTLLREPLESAFYITMLPEFGQLFQAYRTTSCTSSYPASCQDCCEGNFYLDPDEGSTCCAKVASSGKFLFGIGTEITYAPAKVLASESGFLWWRPPLGALNTSVLTRNTTLRFQAEFWATARSPLSAANSTDSGCAADRALCSADAVANARACGTCSARITEFELFLTLVRRRHYPQVGFGGQMIAFDGGDDYLVSEFAKMPQYEFSIQLWFQQNKIRTGQTILTYWSDERGREFEIADTSNIFFYHFNNRSQPTGVSVNDGFWHHLAFSFRLLCAEEKRLPGATYCQESFTCDIQKACSGMEVTIIVDGEKRAIALLPAFLPSQQGIFLWGQRMLRRFKSAEVNLRDAFYQQLRAAELNLTSEIFEAFSDNQLLLMWNRRRSNMNDSLLIEPSIAKEARMGPFTEGEPWRRPHFKYCELLVGGGFNPWTALSANIDEVRVYGYWRDPWAVQVGMNTVLNADSRFTFSEPFANHSLILYYNFDLYGKDFSYWSKDDFLRYPLDIKDEAPEDNSGIPGGARLGGGTFQWAPLQVPSTAPIHGARTIQLTLPDNRTKIPIKLIDTAFDNDTPPEGLFSRIEVTPKYGELMAAEDNCDEVEVVTFDGITYRPRGCRGSILGLRSLGSLGQPTTGCQVGEVITASDGYGSGARGVIRQVSGTGGIVEVEMVSTGLGYDWTLSVVTQLQTDSATCLCGGNPTSTLGVLNECVEPLISQGQGVTSGDEFVGYDMGQPGATNGLPVNYKVTCNGGQCEGVKPRPCTHACFRQEGWMTDVQVTVDQFRKFSIGPYTEYVEAGFETTYWSNREHTVWYVPSHLREYPYYLKDAEGVDILQDTIKDEFMVRKFDFLPPNELVVDPDNPPPFVHHWVQVVIEKLAIPLNSSIIWEESSEMLIQLTFVDFDKGTSILNAPFEIYADPPANGTGRLYQAERVTLSDGVVNVSECICASAPGFDDPEVEATASRVCDKSQLGNYCMRRGKEITRADTLVTSYVDTRIVPGFQHARDGFFVVYDMGKYQSGEAYFNWRMRHPQGQTQEAHVNISVRASNNPPVAVGGAYATLEDTMVEIRLPGSDPDDTELPATYVTEFPRYGHLYQCLAENLSAPCAVGEAISVTDEASTQYATVVVDPAGAIDDAETPVHRFLDPLDVTDSRLVRNKATSDTVLHAGYGVGSWSFDPDDNGNFRMLCGGRDTVAADLHVPFPVFVTSVEVMYDIRYDTPFRILARKQRTYPDQSHDYNFDAVSGEFADVLTAQAEIAQRGMRLGTETDPNLRFEDSGQYRASQTFTSSRVSCDAATNGISDCNQVWNGTRWVRGEERTYVTADDDRWFELYRGLPHQSQLHSDRFAPVFPDTSFQTTQVRIEACGQAGRTFDGRAANFLEAVQEVVVQGKRAARPRGFVRDAARRLLYIPDHNFVGADSLRFAVRDHGFGAKRSSATFSSRIYWSPTVQIDLTVTARKDTPLGTAVVLSQITAPVEQGVVFPLPGTHPGFDGLSPVSSFLVSVTEMPQRGTLFTDKARGVAAVPGGAYVDFPDELGFTVDAHTCGKPFAQFRYRLKNVTAGDDLPTAEYIITIEIRCTTGRVCDHSTGVCRDCPQGTFGSHSGADFTCEICPAGFYQDEAGALGCKMCPPGTYSAIPGSNQCRPCPHGTFNARSGQMRCEACPGGTYAPVQRMLQCLKCGVQAYTLTTGSTSCISCPPNTKAKSETSIGQHSCQCEFGTYDVQGRGGRRCLPCPHGAYCSGRRLLPVARTGYWTSRELWTNDTFDAVTGARTPGEAVFAPCSFRYIRGVCIGYPDVDVQEAEEHCQYKDAQITHGPRVLDAYTSQGVDVAISDCTLRALEHPREGLRSWDSRLGYEANSYCAGGYTGIVCSDCVDGWYRDIVGHCTPCHLFYGVPLVGLLYFAFLAVLVVAFWMAMFVLSAHRARCFYIIITHMQLCGILSGARVPWPLSAQSALNALSLLNLNLDGIQWECTGVRWDEFHLRFFIQALIPAALVILFPGYNYFRTKQAYLDIAAGNAQWKNRKEQRHRRRAKMNEVASVASSSQFGGMASDDESVETVSEKSELSDHSVNSSDKSSGGDNDNQEVTAKQLRQAVEQNRGPRKQKGKRVRVLDRDEVRVLSKKQIHRLRDTGVWWTSLALNLLFLSAVSACFIPWSCTHVLPADLHYLDARPGFSCDSGAYQGMFITSLVVGSAWLFAFPAVQMFILRQGWRNELILDRVFVREFGFLTECYQMKWCYWEMAVILRKAVFAVSVGFVSRSGYIQLLALATYSVVHLGFTFYCMPHRSRLHNYCDIWLQVQLVLIILAALTNIVGQTGLKIITTTFGAENAKLRIPLLQPQPHMDDFAGVEIDGVWTLNLVFLLILGGSYTVAVGMLFLDIYEGRPQAPRWMPYLFNAFTGLPLFAWDEIVSRLGTSLDRTLAIVRDRYKPKPPERPSSRWAHRAAMQEGEAEMGEFHKEDTVEDMLNAVVRATEEEEWARDKESVLAYIHSLDRRIFAAEMYNSKAPNLPVLERERNRAKKRLMLYWHNEVAETFRALYEQTGRNEQTMWDMQEVERLRQHHIIEAVAQEEHGQQLKTENDQQTRRVGDVEGWKSAYQRELEHCEDLERQVKQARDAVTLYHLEESGSSEDERDIDEYLRGRITEHIAGKTAQQLLREGKMSALPNFEPRD